MVKRKQLTFGQIIADARHRAGLNLRDAANRIKKEDGEPISYQYLNDLEKDRRKPPVDHLIDEIAKVYGISRSYLYLLARRIPSDLPVIVGEGQAEAAYQEFCKRLEEYAAA
jgi:transcriptional regulator with XRE-family HTH domain